MHPQPENLKQASRGRWNPLAISSRHRRLARMKSFLGMLFTLLVLTAVIGGGALSNCQDPNPNSGVRLCRNRVGGLGPVS